MIRYRCPMFCRLSFPHGAWERPLATLRVTFDLRAAETRDTERPGLRSHAERGKEGEILALVNLLLEMLDKCV